MSNALKDDIYPNKPKEIPPTLVIYVVAEHIGVKAVDVRKGHFEIFNKYYFKDLSDYDIRWSLYEDGKEIRFGFVNSGMIPARAKAQVSIPMPFDKLKNDSEYFVKVQFLLKDDMPWAE